MPTTDAAPLMSALPVTLRVAGSMRDDGFAVDQTDDRARLRAIRREKRRGQCAGQGDCFQMHGNLPFS
jgi:hypothetical protein